MAFPTFFGAAVEWVSFVPAALALFAAAKAKISLKKCFWGGFWLVYVQNVIVFHWFFSFYPLEFTDISKPGAAGVVLIAVLGLPILAAIFGGLMGILLIAASRTPLAKRFPVLLPFCMAASYVFCEWIRTKFWFGVPWGRLALGQLTDGVSLSVLSLSVFGTYFVTFLIVLVSSLLAQALASGKLKLRIVLSLILILANIAVGLVICKIPAEVESTVSVAAIQANINSREKWSDTYYDAFIKYDNLTKKAAADGADIIIWPETAVLDNSYIIDIIHLARDLKVHILFGCFDYTAEGSPLNVLCLVRPDGTIYETLYAKRHLVPFGEYVPMRDFIMKVFPPLGEIAMISEDIIPGDGSNLYEIEIDGQIINIGGLICFDSIYEQLSYDTAASGADMICMATNDSWFEDSRAVYMHCAQSRLRAIETGIPIVRAANTGISASITRLGEVVESIPPLVEGYIVSEVQIASEANNSKIGNSVFLMLCALMIAVFPAEAAIEYCFKKSK